MFTFKNFSVVGLTLALCASASADFVITGQSSNSHWHYLYGYGPDSFEDEQVQGNSTLVGSGSLGYVGSLTDQGSYAGTPWDVALDWTTTNSYSTVGTLPNVSNITSEGSSTTTSILNTASGDLVADTDQSIYFSVVGSQAIHLTGAVDQVGSTNRNNAGLFLYKDNGSGYALFMVWEGNATIDHWATFGAGDYKFSTYARSADAGSEFTHASWNYSLTAVPEPTSLAILAPGLIALARRRRK